MVRSQFDFRSLSKRFFTTLTGAETVLQCLRLCAFHCLLSSVICLLNHP